MAQPLLDSLAMRTTLACLLLSLLTLGCGEDDGGAPNLPPNSGCCIAEDYPENYDEGAHCCADGIWGADIGNGNAEDACAMLGGVCTEE